MSAARRITEAGAGCARELERWKNDQSWASTSTHATLGIVAWGHRQAIAQRAKGFRCA